MVQSRIVDIRGSIEYQGWEISLKNFFSLFVGITRDTSCHRSLRFVLPHSSFVIQKIVYVEFCHQPRIGFDRLVKAQCR